MRSTLRRNDLVPDDDARLLRADGFVARVRPWPGEPGTVQLVTVDRSVAPTPAVLAAWLHDLAAHDVVTVRTGALGPSTVGAYLDAGFTVRQELAVLVHPLESVPPARRADARLRGPRTRDLVALAMLDRRAFDRGWGLDVSGIVDACQATPLHRLRLGAVPGLDPAGYAISGRAGRAAYLQRLAVDPAAQGRGLGRALVVDSLRWARHRRASSVLVNTHVDNEAALGLYRRLGFTDLAYRLAVVERAVA